VSRPRFARRVRGRRALTLAFAPRLIIQLSGGCHFGIGCAPKYAASHPGVVKAKEDKLPRRNRYQFGSLEFRKRTRGPDVWLFRYWDRENPSSTRPSITLGTVEDFPTQTDARRAAEGLRLEINNGLPLREAVTFQGLIDRYVSEVIDRGDLAHTTKEPDLNRINKHISPKWGTSLLREVKPYPVQEWLRKLPVAPKTRSHIRGLMYSAPRKGHALGTNSVGTQPHEFGRTEGSQQTNKTATDFDRGGVRGFTQRTRPSLSMHGASRRLYRPSHQRGHGLALDRNQLRDLGHGNQGGICSQPSQQVEIGVFPGRVAAGSGCCNHSSRVEATLPTDDWRLGISEPADKQTLRFWLATEENTQNRGTTSQDSREDWLAHTASQLPRVARRDGCSSRRAAETHASREYLDRDERLWRRLHESEAQSQHVCRPTPAAPRSDQIEKDRLVDDPFSCVQTLQDHFRPQSKIKIPCNPMIALVAGGGFEPPTFGL